MQEKRHKPKHILMITTYPTKRKTSNVAGTSANRCWAVKGGGKQRKRRHTHIQIWYHLHVHLHAHRAEMQMTCTKCNVHEMWDIWTAKPWTQKCYGNAVTLKTPSVQTKTQGKDLVDAYFPESGVSHAPKWNGCFHHNKSFYFIKEEHNKSFSTPEKDAMDT